MTLRRPAVLLAVGLCAAVVVGAIAIGPRPDRKPETSTEVLAAGTATDIAIVDPVHDRPFDASFWEPTGDDRHQLIVISHGFAGDRTSHVESAESLAALGYTVIAPTHPDLGGLESGDVDLDPLFLRPRHLSLAIDEAESLADQPFDQIVVVGHSIGGYTALRSIGVDTTTERLDAHCQAQPSDPILCSAPARDRMAQLDAVQRDTSASPDGASPDGRIDRVVLLAPGYGPLFSAESLGAASVPVLVIEAEGDLELPGTQVDDLIAALPPSTQHKRVEGGHFVFLRACTASEAATIPELCREDAGVDRADVNDEVVSAIDSFAADGNS